ncbi:MAG: hypothetical protein KJ709_04140 [Nanoarchaeota archaeon]|nr:hypothetical protein [Nanoarchaeota archaeon]
MGDLPKVNAGLESAGIFLDSLFDCFETTHISLKVRDEQIRAKLPADFDPLSTCSSIHIL